MNAAEGEAPATRQRRKRLDGPRATFAALIAAVLISGALLANAVLGYAWALESRTRQAQGGAVAGQVAAALGAYVVTLQARADRIAQVLAADVNGVAPMLGEVSTPGAHSLQFVPLDRLGISAPSFDPGKLHGNLEVNLVGETFKGNRVAGETFLDDGQWLLVVGARVGPAEGAARGVVLLRASLDAALRETMCPLLRWGSTSC
jgi:hypothetical protein